MIPPWTRRSMASLSAAAGSLVIAVLCGYLLTGAGPAGAAFPGVNGRFVFATDRGERNGDGEIYVMNPDGGGLQRLTANETWDLHPAWSPDGRRIVFAGGGDPYVTAAIYVMNADGGRRTQLFYEPTWDEPANYFRGPMNPVWSPDGQKIAFTQGHIYVMSAAGDAIRRITSCLPTQRTCGVVGSQYGSELSWSPDGRAIVFSGAFSEQWLRGFPDLYVVSVDDGSIRQLTKIGQAAEPEWSPDGKTIAFVETGPKGGIYAIRPDGTGLRRVTDLSARDLAWSPDGTRIAFSSSDGAIYTMSPDGSRVARISGNHTNALDIDWQPLARAKPPAASTPDAVVAYAPLVYLHPDEQYYPMNASAFIASSSLRWAHDQRCRDHEVAARGSVVGASLGEGRYSHPTASGAPSCRDGKQGFTSAQHTRPFDVERVPGLPLGEGFYLDLDDTCQAGIVREGRCRPGDPTLFTGAPVYYDYAPRQFITYWFFYGFSAPVGGKLPLGRHESDWERITVRLDGDDQATAVWYYQHGCPRFVVDRSSKEWPGVFVDGHPVVYSANGSHASYPWPGARAFEECLGSKKIGKFDWPRSGGRPWATRKLLLPVQEQPWYGFGGAWGETGLSEADTGPLGPSKYRDRF